MGPSFHDIDDRRWPCFPPHPLCFTIEGGHDSPPHPLCFYVILLVHLLLKSRNQGWVRHLSECLVYQRVEKNGKGSEMMMILEKA